MRMRLKGTESQKHGCQNCPCDVRTRVWKKLHNLHFISRTRTHVWFPLSRTTKLLIEILQNRRICSKKILFWFFFLPLQIGQTDLMLLATKCVLHNLKRTMRPVFAAQILARQLFHCSFLHQAGGGERASHISASRKVGLPASTRRQEKREQVF